MNETQPLLGWGPPGTGELAAARRDLARAAARVAEMAVWYADARTAADRQDDRSACAGGERVRPGEFAADEVSVVLREQPYQMRCLLARTRRLAATLPTVWEAFRAGDLDPEQVRVIDRAARRVAEVATVAAIDHQVVPAAQTRTPKQLQLWLWRLVVALEPAEFAIRHRRALAERRVTVVQGGTRSAT